MKTESAWKSELLENSKYNNVHGIKIIGQSKLNSEIDYVERLRRERRQKLGNNVSKDEEGFILYEIPKEDQE